MVGKANSWSFVYSTLLQNVGAISLQRYIKKQKNKITDSKNSEKKKVVMQTLARNENKSTCWCDLNPSTDGTQILFKTSQQPL